MDFSERLNYSGIQMCQKSRKKPELEYFGSGPKEQVYNNTPQYSRPN